MAKTEAQRNGPQPVDGPKQGPDKPYTSFATTSTSLPFGQAIGLTDIEGPTYLTAQTLIQQVAYTLSDRLWTYSPDTFDLDVAVKQWSKDGTQNAHGYTTSVDAMQIRSGAATIALGYLFSKDFNLSKRYIPQSIITSSASLQYLRSALDQLSLLYSVASPVVAHVAAVDYVGAGKPSLVSDYVAALGMAEDLGLGVVSSFSAFEAQHMSLFATLLANLLPTLHIYDGIKVGRETTRIIDVLGQKGISNYYDSVLKAVNLKSRKSPEAKAMQLLKAFNEELGTEYNLFEYSGDPEAEVVLVAFGTVESSLAATVARSLARNGSKVGVVNVRVYRPFHEDAFLAAVPKTARTVGALGQVDSKAIVNDSGLQSQLYSDVLAAFSFAPDWEQSPAVVDVKYPREQIWTPLTMTASFQYLVSKPFFEPDSPGLQLDDLLETQQYIFWNSDDSKTGDAATVLGKALSKDSASNVSVSTKHANLVQGGTSRTDIRRSRKSVDAPYAIDVAGVIYVDEIDLLKSVDVTSSLAIEGKVLIRLPAVKDEDLEKKLPIHFRKAVAEKKARLYILDPQKVQKVAEEEELESPLVQIAWLRTALPSQEGLGIKKLSAYSANEQVLEELSQSLNEALREIEIPEAWAQVEKDTELPVLPFDVRATSFLPFDKKEPEAPTDLSNWQSIAKALAFKEVLGTKTALRPDHNGQNWEITLVEHRRLTPETYDRNIMHLEFDLGDTGMEYHIGDSLGVHPRNDAEQVEAFIRDYGLDAGAIVEAQHTGSVEQKQARTVYQALIEQVDIFGKPGKQFYEQLAEFAMNETERKTLLSIAGLEGNNEFKRRSEVDTITYADILEEFPSAHPDFHDLIRMVQPLKRREYSIASCQKAQPNTIALMIVTVNWQDPRGRDRWGLCTRYLDALPVGSQVTVSLKPSVMKLPPQPSDPIIMAGLGTGLAPFRAFVQHRALEKASGVDIGPVLLYMGSRHQREEYCYGEEWEAYRDAGVISLLSCAFSRDQPQKIYIQDRMRQTGDEILDAYLRKPGAFYLCGPTWPVPDVTAVLEEAIGRHAKQQGKKVAVNTELEKLKDAGRYVLEVY